MIGVPQCAIVNTSPLIHLAEAGLLSLLQNAAPSIWVPEPVAREIRAYGETDPTARALASNPWLEVHQVAPLDEDILGWYLGAGESSVVMLARSTKDSMVVIDDLAGRRCAEALGLKLRGTLGLVPVEKLAGRIERARPLPETLRDGGMYLSDSTLRRALALVGE